MSLLSAIYGFFANLHRGLYHFGFIKSIKVKKPVFSVGNLAFGGTGKTPFVKMLVADVKALGLKPAIVTRSYKAGAVESSLLTQEKAQNPETWGDEACWYFNNLKVPVYSGPRKWESAVLASQNSDIDFIILDDGFQHHRLHKDFDVVLIDAVSGIKGLKNRSRESISTLKFADAIILTKANLVTVEVVERIKEVLPKSKPVFLNSLRVKCLKNLAGQVIELKGQRIGLVSGIAHPGSFAAAFSQKFPNKQIFKLEFSDHHAYKQDDLKKIVSFTTENKLDFVVMTEKDEVKIKNLLTNSSDSNLVQSLSSIGIMQIESQFENHEEWINHLKRLIK